MTAPPAQSSELPVAFKCPSCGQRLLLAHRASSLACARCGWLAAGSDGVLDFVGDAERDHERAYYETEYGRSGPPASTPRPLASTAAPWHDPIRPVNRLLWSLIGDLRGRTVLLIGNGGSAKELHLLTKQPAVLVFSDLAKAGVQRVAVSYDLGADRERIVFASIDALDLPLADESIDLVYGNAIMHHLPDVDRCLAEIARVLRPGGRGLFMDDAYSPVWQRAKTTVLRPLMRLSHRLHERSPEDIRETMAGGFREDELARRIRAVGCEPRFHRQGLVYYLWHRMSLVLFTRHFPRVASSRRLAGALIALDERIARFPVVRRNQIRLVWEVRKRL